MFNFILQILFWALIGDALMMALAPWFWFFDLFVTYVPQFSILTLIAICLLLIRKQITQAVVLMLALVWFALPLLALLVPPVGSDRPVSGQHLSVLHANALYRNRNYDLLIDEIRKENPTILELNEVTSGWLAAIKKEFPVYTYEAASPSEDYRGIAVLSQIPIASHKIIPFGDENAPIIEVHFAKPAFTLFAVHPLSPVSERWAYERNKQIEILGGLVAATEGSVIVAGDLNATIHSAVFQKFLKQTGLIDGRRGFGWRPTWLRGTILSAAIDHILYRGAFHIQNFRVLSDIHSDHRPIVASFIFEDNEVNNQE